MFRKIIVGVDGAAGGRDAVALAGALSSPGTTVTLAHAFPYERHASRASIVGYEELLRDDAMELLRAAAGDRTELELRAVADPSPGRALQTLAQEERADLVVVGSCHREHALARLVLGDTARSTLHGAPCAVAIAPRGYAAHVGPFATVGVGVDDRPESHVALELGHQLAREAGCGLRLRTAVSVPAAYAPTYAYVIDWASLHEDLATNARHALTDVEEGIQDVPVVVEVDKERAVDSLAKLSELVDLLVVGSRSWGTFGRVLVGSTADSLLRHAHCPVIVVPPARVPEPQTAPAEQAAAA